MILGGIILLLPGLCAMLFAFSNSQVAGPRFLLVIISIISIGGAVALIWGAFRRARSTRR